MVVFAATFVAPSAGEVDITVGGTVPVPVAVTVLLGLTGSLLLIVILADLGPADVGEKVTTQIPLEPGAIDVEAGGVMMNSPESDVTDATCSVCPVSPVLVIVRFCPELVVPEAWFPKAIVDGDMEQTGATPVPLTATFCVVAPVEAFVILPPFAPLL